MRPRISILHTGYTSLGTGTAKTQLGGSSVILPSWAKSILAVIPQVTIDVPTVSESVLPLLEVESNDVSIMPYQVLVSPINATLGATVGALNLGNEKYAVGAPVQGGEQIDVYMKALVANTAAPNGGCGIVVSDRPAGHKQRHAKVGTLTSSGTTATSDVAGTRYNFSNAKHIVELMGMFGHGTVAAADAINAYIKFTSSEFDGISDARLPLEPIAGGLSTIFSTCTKVARAPVDIPVFDGQVNIQDYLYMGLAPAAAGNFLSGVIYE